MEESEGEALKILVVNDEPFQLMMIEILIESIRNVHVFQAINGDLAVR